MANNRKGLQDFLITLLVMAIIFVLGYFLLVQFVEATPAEDALSDVKAAIESVCTKEGTLSRSFVVILPAGHNIFLQPNGFLKVYKGAFQVSKKTLNCPSALVFPECTFGPTTEGNESISFSVNKTIDIVTKQSNITLTDTTGRGLLNCEVPY